MSKVRQSTLRDIGTSLKRDGKFKVKHRSRMKLPPRDEAWEGTRDPGHPGAMVRTA
jgi:hypothetical protein